MSSLLRLSFLNNSRADNITKNLFVQWTFYEPRGRCPQTPTRFLKKSGAKIIKKSRIARFLSFLSNFFPKKFVGFGAKSRDFKNCGALHFHLPLPGKLFTIHEVTKSIGNKPATDWV